MTAKNSAMPLLDIRGLGKKFAPKDPTAPAPWILKDLSFSIGDGEFLTIIGPSGSGKSTLLNMISQVDVPSEGEIRLRGEVISNPQMQSLNPGWKRNIGYVTQEDNLLPWRTCRDNVLFPFEVQNNLTRETRRRADELMESVGLKGFERHYPHELSGGMRKRASLIRTLVYDPPLILMDEPFGALDAQTRIQLQSDLLDLWQQGKKTIIFITHDISEAIALADRTVVLTRSPAKIAGEHPIDIPRPRNIHDVYSMEAFPRIYANIRAQVQ